MLTSVHNVNESLILYQLSYHVETWYAVDVFKVWRQETENALPANKFLTKTGNRLQGTKIWKSMFKLVKNFKYQNVLTLHIVKCALSFKMSYVLNETFGARK